jgi:hypothetical protein
MYELPEHWTNWITRKSHRTHFLRPGTSSPANNSALLYDGSAEARKILRVAIDYCEDGKLRVSLMRALDYLKGCFIGPYRFSYTADFFGPTPEVWLTQIMGRLEFSPESLRRVQSVEEKPELVQIAPLTFPDKPTGPVDVAVFDDAHSEEYPGYSVQNQKPLKVHFIKDQKDVPKTPGC